MLVRTFSAVVQGLQPVKIEVEVDNTIGTPQFVIIGLPTKEIDEAKERITAALLNCNIRIRAKRTIVNLAPADVRKTGSGLELAIAVGLLKLYEELPLNTDQTMFFGELSLDGSIKAVRGALPLVVAAKKMGFTSVVLPNANSAEVQTISGITIHPVHQFLEVIQSLRQEIDLPVLQHTPFKSVKRAEPEVDFVDIVGQSMAKRALEIAAAGGHNLFLIGPPGAGKSMLAQAMGEILPPLTQGEATEITGIYSIAGLLGENRSFITTRPFRSPHHSTSLAGLTGGGVPLLPGEVSLAHNGVLFLDEIPEFPRYCLEALRQPLENRSITLTRASGSFSFPARFSLIAAANPCPCGFFGSKLRVCQCSRQQRHLYANRISGPLLDRIDLQVWTSETPVAELHAAHFTHGKNIDSTKHIGERVARARQRQQENFKRHTLPISCNAELSTKQVKSYCHLKQEAQV
nr:YifB family Mg chelatase-like AAA ATPase [Candidatus Woesebacteria bacterium]